MPSAKATERSGLKFSGMRVPRSVAARVRVSPLSNVFSTCSILEALEPFFRKSCAEFPVVASFTGILFPVSVSFTGTALPVVTS